MKHARLSGTILVFLLLSFLAVAGSPAGDGRHKKSLPTSSAPDLAKGSEARPLVRVTVEGNSGLNIQGTDYQSGALRISGKLLSIDGKSLRGRSLRQIEELLDGGAGSEVEITYLDRSSRPFSERIKRVPSKMDGIIDEEKERYLFRTLQDESVVNWSTRSAYGDNYYERNNLDLFSRAARNVLIERALDLPPPRKSLVFHTAVGGLIAGDCIGDWQGANRCLRLISANRECNLGSTEYRNKFLDKLIDHLILTGRIKEAKTLMDGWIAFAGSTSEKEPLHVRFEGLWQALKRSAEIEMISDDKSLKPTLVQMQQIQSRLQHRLKYGDDIEWLADALAGSGDTKGAIAYFEKQKKFQTKNFSLEDELSLDTFSVAACPDVRIAKLKALEGDHDGALSTLTGLIDLMDKHLSSEKREQAEKIPFYFPARSDLEIELALVYEAKGALDVAERQARAAVLRIEKAQGSDAQSLRKPLKILSRILKSRGKSSESREISSRAGAIMPESKPDLTESQKFSLIQSTRNAILKDDTKEARTGITRLLEAYSNEAPVYDFHRRPINLFCSILSLSRDLCDHRQFGEADRVLDFLRSAALCKEHTPAALSMIDIEKALSAEARGNSKSAWAIVDRNNSLVQKENSFHRRQKPEPGPDFFKVLRTQENMRRFASLYSAAGYPDRADRLIRRALDLNKNNSLITSSSNLDMIESNIMLFLDGAVIRARQGRADEAMRLAGRAISISSDVVSSDNEHNGREFYGGRNYKTIQLAQILESKGHETEALALLEALGPKLASKTRHDVDKMSDSRDRWDANVRLKEDGIVHAYTARLQLFKGRVKDAGTSINLAIEQAGNNVPMPYYLLGARIAESAGNNAMAAHCYSEAARHESMSSLGVNISGTGLTRSNLEKSIGFAEKAPDLDRSELANIYVRFAGDLENSRAEADPKRALEYYLKASNLLPDSMERKVDLLRKIAALKQRIANQAQGKQATSNAGDGGGGPAAISAEEKERRSIAEAKSQIQAGLQAAKLAESTGRRDAFQLWIQLAYLEAQAREPEKALADARHGISLFRVQGDPVINFKGLLPGAYGLITSLCEQDKSVQAEALLQEANAKVSSIFGTKSPQYAYQLCQYFVFLLKQNRDADALKVLDRVLSIGIRRIEIGCSIVNPLSTIERTAEGLAREKRGELGLKIMERVLAVEKVELEKDDCRICDTLLTVSRVYSAQERFALAKESLDQALSIKRLYLGKRRAMAELAPAMMPVFKGLDKPDELERLNALARNRYRISPDTVDPQFFHENREIAKLYQSWKSNPKTVVMLAELDTARKQAPYSQRTIGAISSLLEYAKYHKDWTLLASMAKERVDIYRRFPDPNAGRQMGCVPPAFHRMDYYYMAVDAAINLGDTAGARRWVERAESELIEPALHEQIEMAALENKLGNRDKAIEMAEEIERRIDTETWLYQRLAGLWSQLGDRNRVLNLQTKSREAMEQSRRKSEQIRNNPLSGLR